MEVSSVQPAGQVSHVFVVCVPLFRLSNVAGEGLSPAIAQQPWHVPVEVGPETTPVMFPIVGVPVPPREVHIAAVPAAQPEVTVHEPVPVPTFTVPLTFVLKTPLSVQS